MPTQPTNPLINGQPAPSGVPPFQQGLRRPPDPDEGIPLTIAQSQVTRALLGSTEANPFANLPRDELLLLQDDLTLRRRELERQRRMIPPSFSQLEAISPFREAPTRTENPFLRLIIDYLNRRGV